MLLIRSCPRCTNKILKPNLYRSAHAATAQQSDVGNPNNSSSSSSSSSTTSSSTSSSRYFTPNDNKGKSRESDYRFPTKGRYGGPPDPYEILGLDRSATHEEVKQQYYRLALLLHPDSSHPSSCSQNFSKLHKAYTLLSKPSSRLRYLQSGYGWNSNPNSLNDNDNDGHGQSSVDEYMRAEARFRGRSGAASWDTRPEYGSRYRRRYSYGHGNGNGTGYNGFGYGEARGAFGGFTNGDGKWEPYDTGEFNYAYANGNGNSGRKGEERYMSNLQFFGLIGAISTALTWAQYQRFLSAQDSHQQLLQQQHLDASHALAEARREAAQHGKERRERIRRRVRENEVIRELERMELQGGGRARGGGE